MMMSRSLTGALCCAAAVTASAAEPAESASDRPIERVVVTSHPLSAEGLALSSEVLEGEELTRKLASSIGETVGHEPGVHAANFGQATSRPVIHGLSGPRVRIMEDRIDALDVSVTSADHAVTIEPFIADRIEVLKGPSTLLYGSGAIGGVVDVHTGRIPHEQPSEPFSGRAELRYGENGDRTTAAARLDGGTGSFAWHLDGFDRQADPYEIPGFAESAILRRQEGTTDEGSREEARDVLPGSQLEARGGAAGVAVAGERGFAGIAVSTVDADYGLPGGHGHEHGEDEHGEEAHDEAQASEAPTVDLSQTRIDLEGGLSDPFRGFESLNVRVGLNDYRHREIEPDGEVATTFDNEAVEARVELTHHPLAGISGALGLQYSDRDFSAVGEEAFIPPVETTSLGGFWVGERTFTHFDVEGGLRLETVEVDPSNAAGTDFSPYALSLGMILPFGDAWSVGLLVDHTTRAPIAEELYSFGPHLATGVFEVGQPGLDEEKAVSLSANLRYAGERWFFSATAYRNDFTDFIYEAPTGDERDDLPVFRYTQDDATFIGVDLEARATVAEWERASLELRAQYDTVSGEVEVSGNDNLPRIPPDRYGLGLSGRWGPMRASLDHTWVREQDQTADFELPTAAYEDLRAYLGADLRLGPGAELTLFVQGSNLTDQDQRQHASFIKDLAPLPGRTVEAGIRARF